MMATTCVFVDEDGTRFRDVLVTVNRSDEGVTIVVSVQDALGNSDGYVDFRISDESARQLAQMIRGE